MKSISLALGVLLIALVAPAPLAPASLADARGCSPIPEVVDIRCLDVPGAGAVALYHAGFGSVEVAATAGMGCGAPILSAVDEVYVVCNPLTCMGPHAFGMVSDPVNDVRATAACSGASATCDTTGLPSWCMAGSTTFVGSAPFTCTAKTLSGPLTSYVWWVQCSQPA